MSNIYTRRVPIGVLLEFGFSEQEANQVCSGRNTIAWHELAKHDGITAIRALTDEEYARIVAYLKPDAIAAGVPFEESNRNFVPSLVWGAAEASVPPKGNPWYSHVLHSAVACAILLRLVAEAFGKSAQEQAAQDSQSFAAKLGVAQ